MDYGCGKGKGGFDGGRGGRGGRGKGADGGRSGRGKGDRDRAGKGGKGRERRYDDEAPLPGTPAQAASPGDIPPSLVADVVALRKLRDESECEELKLAWSSDDPREWHHNQSENVITGDSYPMLRVTKFEFDLGRYDIDKTPPLHFSATAAVLGATDYHDDDVQPRRALKVMRDLSTVLAELKGREGLDSKFVVAVVGVHVSKDVNAADRSSIVEAAQQLRKEIVVDAEVDFGSLSGVLAKSDRAKDDVDNKRYTGFKYIVVMELADRSLGTALLHERIASNEWPLVRKIGGDLARALDNI